MKLQVQELNPGDMIITNRGCETVITIWVAGAHAQLTTDWGRRVLLITDEVTYLAPVDDEED